MLDNAYQRTDPRCEKDNCGAYLSSRIAKVGIVGLGYVGPPLAVEFAKVHHGKVGAQINDGCSYIQDVPSADIDALVASGKLRATSDFSVVARLDTIDIAVPTPLRKTASGLFHSVPT